MGSAQRRIGPLNLGWYGILSSIINGCNLIISQLIIPKLHFYFGFQFFPVLFLLFSITSYSIIYPFYLINLMLSVILIIIISGVSILLLILSAFSGNSKYSMLGCIRIASQLISFELIWTTILLVFIWSFNEVSIAGLWMVLFARHYVPRFLLCLLAFIARSSLISFALLFAPL